MRGKFITFEGGEGSGKSTQILLLEEFLKSNDIPVVVCREPGGTKISEGIREIIINKENTNMDSLTELFLFLAARRQNVVEFIEPSLELGIWVLCDRFIDSSTVYQGICRGIGLETVESYNKKMVGNTFPDRTFYLDIEVIEGLTRVRNRGNTNRLDLESLKFHNEVRGGYKLLCEKYKSRMTLIDASYSVDIVSREICKSIYNEFLREKIKNKGVK